MEDMVVATVRIQSSVARISEVLLDAERLPEWNPAFLEVAPASAGAEAEHLIRVRGGLSGAFRYTRVDAQRIESAWHVQGLSETNYWNLRQDGDRIVVEHGFRHSGVLAAAMRRAFASAAELRVNRLKLQVEPVPAA